MTTVVSTPQIYKTSFLDMVAFAPHSGDINAPITFKFMNLIKFVGNCNWTFN